ncbi:MAG: tRNA lysidine(34) synthetase TilS [Spirochaetales bacterium]|nr:tRNA lysidine(34) synthetase TilS [Spirochaetales bacterium]
MNSTERAFSEKIKSLICDGSRVLVAFSGGCDSLALLALCARTLGKDKVTAVYVNHRLRDEYELEKEIDLNRRNCTALGVSLIIRELDEGAVRTLASERGGGTEDAARHLRYKVLEEERVRTGSTWILTAHHRQDHVETILMRLRSGSPSVTLLAIREKDERRCLLRPILDLTRAELEAYNKELGLEWSTDSTNSDARYTRNLIRNQAIPEIQAIWPDFENSILALADSASGQDEELSGIRISLPFSLSCFEGKTTSSRIQILYRLWDGVFPERELPMTLLSRVLEAIAGGSDCTVGANGALFTVYHGSLYLTDPDENGLYNSFCRELPAEAVTRVDLPGGMILRRGAEAATYLHVSEADASLSLHMDSSLFRGRTVIRFSKDGDRIRLKGGWKSIGRLLQDMGIPAFLRCRVPVLEDQDGICAVFGSVQGGKDRICVKFRTSLAPNDFPLYIVSKG